MKPRNLHSPAATPASAGELLDVLVSSPTAKTLRIQRIESPPSHSSEPGFWYDQADSEWVVLLEGSATLTFKDPDESIDLVPGDHLTIPPGRRHRIERTDPDSPTLWLAVHWEE